MHLQEPVILEAVRTPIGKDQGVFKEVRPDDLDAFILKALIERVGISPREVEDVV